MAVGWSVSDRAVDGPAAEVSGRLSRQAIAILENSGVLRRNFTSGIPESAFGGYETNRERYKHAAACMQEFQLRYCNTIPICRCAGLHLATLAYHNPQYNSWFLEPVRCVCKTK